MKILRSYWLPERARWSYLARSGLPAVTSGKKNFPRSHIINPLLTKLVRSRWLDIGLVLFCEFMDFDCVSVHKHAKKKELGQYPAILNHLDLNRTFHFIRVQSASTNDLNSAGVQDSVILCTSQPIRWCKDLTLPQVTAIRDLLPVVSDLKECLQAF